MDLTSKGYQTIHDQSILLDKGIEKLIVIGINEDLQINISLEDPDEVECDWDTWWVSCNFNLELAVGVICICRPLGNQEYIAFKAKRKFFNVNKKLIVKGINCNLLVSGISRDNRTLTITATKTLPTLRSLAKHAVIAQTFTKNTLIYSLRKIYGMEMVNNPFLGSCLLTIEQLKLINHKYNIYAYESWDRRCWHHHHNIMTRSMSWQRDRINLSEEF